MSPWLQWGFCVVCVIVGAMWKWVQRGSGSVRVEPGSGEQGKGRE